jgi:DNA-binding NarL/FixJ family response regulator
MKRFTPRAPGEIRLGIYDSHALFRHGLRWHYAHVGHIQVTEDAEPPQPLDAWLAAIRVDVVLLDVAHALPDVAGRSPAPAARCRWIALSDTDHRTTLLRAAHAGAMAILTRDTAPDTITQTIERDACGERLIAESLAQCTDAVEEVFHRSRIGSTLADPTDLTTRELEVLDCLARGQTTAQIATELVITIQTVKNHLSSIMNKLSAPDRAMALLEAVRRGWISLEPTTRPVVHLAERRTSYTAGLVRRRRIALMRRRS